jgi:hypothetical protein
VRTRGGHFERALGRDLAANISITGRAGGSVFVAGAVGRGGCKFLRARQQGDDLGEMAHAVPRATAGCVNDRGDRDPYNPSLPALFSLNKLPSRMYRLTI